jgi:hypothetical protein
MLFPLQDPTFKNGDKVGEDRVLAIVSGTMRGSFSDPVYCLSVTHRGETNRALAPCKNA